MLFEDYKKNPNSGRNSVNEIIFKEVRCAIGHLVGTKTNCSLVKMPKTNLLYASHTCKIKKKYL